MSFGTKIGAILFGVALTPVLVIGVSSYQATRDELTRVVQRSQEDTAAELARSTETTVLHAVEALTLTTRALPLDDFSEGELSEVLRIPLRQVAGVTAIALIGADGVSIVPPVYESALEREAPALDQMARHVPLEAALSLGAAVGPPYLVGARAPRVVLAVSQGQRVIAAELSLTSVSARLAELDEKGTHAVLVDGTGAPLAGADSLSTGERELIARRALGSAAVDAPGGEARLAAFAPTTTLGWGVLTSRPRAVALGAANRVRDYTLFWAALAFVLAGSLSVWLARGISRPIASLSAAARALLEGRYDAKVPVLEGRDELAAFGNTFHQMAGEIRRRDLEISGWNRELQQRVDQRTAELAEAQEQVLRSRRLAALGSLGAGIAHELNNPLTGVLGLVALVRMNMPANSEDAETLRLVLEQARRMGQIIERLQAFTDTERRAGGAVFSLERPVTLALEAVAERLTAQQITVTTRFAPGVPDVQGDEGRLREVVSHLVDNAANAMPGGGRLEVELDSVEGQAVKLTVTDSGRGIPPEHRERIFDPFFTTKEDSAGTAVGLGLSTCNHIVEQHHGKLTVDSEPGRTTFTVLLPISSERPHLA